MGCKYAEAINRFMKCGIIPFNPLVFGEVDFVPDKRNGNEDRASSKVFTREEPVGAANVESPEQEGFGASTLIFSSFDL
jgi:hypothetical protein